jgi:hypothetical protein
MHITCTIFVHSYDQLYVMFYFYNMFRPFCSFPGYFKIFLEICYYYYIVVIFFTLISTLKLRSSKLNLILYLLRQSFYQLRYRVRVNNSTSYLQHQPKYPGYEINKKKYPQDTQF